MKIPLSPPKLSDISHEELMAAINLRGEPLLNGKYIHWDDLRHRHPPTNVTHKIWWSALLLARLGLRQNLPLLDKYDKPMVFAMPELVLRDLHHIDQDTSGQIKLPGAAPGQHDGEDHLVNSLIEESITSSQIEGASTTRVVAEAMLREGRKPRDYSELMIFNNYRAMRWIRTIKDAPLTPALMLELHRVVTQDTLEDPDDAGRLRQHNDVRVLDNRDGTVLHEPPMADSLQQRLQRLCDFANQGVDDTPCVHPVVRAILLHFMLGYDHPFADGNGRTARALFYWSMARQGYWLMEFLSISRIIKEAPAQYSLAYLHTETDGNDTTYFLIHQLRVIRKAIAALHEDLARKSKAQQDTAHLLHTSRVLSGQLNHRQIALLTHALKYPGFDYFIESHQNSRGVSYATARSDLLSLAALGLLEQTKRGRGFVFIAPDDLRARIESSATRQGLTYGVP
jgi:Fic family protein